MNSCGMTAYASGISANTPTAPAMHSAQVAGRSGFGRCSRQKAIPKPMVMMTHDQDQAAGGPHPWQPVRVSRLGIVRLVLRFRGAGGRSSTASYHAIGSRDPSRVRETAVATVGARDAPRPRATMRACDRRVARAGTRSRDHKRTSGRR